MSARTGGYILLQLLFDLSRPGGQADRVLNGPTNDVWIDPWLAHLRSLGVDYRSEHQVQAIHCADGRITGVDVVAGGNAYEESGDLYVAALPVEVMRLLLSDELKQAEPRLARLHRLRTRWMNGIMFYLDRDLPLVHGHTVYIDSPWALTSISQAQFWPALELEEMGDGRVDGILSVDVSDWEAPGIVHGKQAMYCSKEEVREEVWAQLEAGLEDAGIDVLDDANVLALVPRSRDRLPEPDDRDESRAAADQHRRLLGGPPRGRDLDRQPLPGLRLRSNAHRPGDDGGRERSRPQGGQRHPRTDGLEPAALPAVEAHGAGDLRSGARPRPRAFRASPAAPAAVPGRRRADRGLRRRLARGLRRRAGLADRALVGDDYRDIRTNRDFDQMSASRSQHPDHHLPSSLSTIKRSSSSASSSDPRSRSTFRNALIAERVRSGWSAVRGAIRSRISHLLVNLRWFLLGGMVFFTAAYPAVFSAGRSPLGTLPSAGGDMGVRSTQPVPAKRGLVNRSVVALFATLASLAVILLAVAVPGSMGDGRALASHVGCGAVITTDTRSTATWSTARTTAS